MSISYVRPGRSTRPTAPISYRNTTREAARTADRLAHADACKAWARRIDGAVGAAKGRPAPGTPPRIVLQPGQTVQLSARGARLVSDI